MNSVRGKLVGTMALLWISSIAAANLKMPLETIREMATVNTVNGKCSFRVGSIEEADGVRSLKLNLTRKGSPEEQTIILRDDSGVWSESQGINDPKDPFWRFLLKDESAVAGGSVTGMNWVVEGPALRTKSLSLSYLDAAAQEVKVNCL